LSPSTIATPGSSRFSDNQSTDIFFRIDTHHAVSVGRDFRTALRLYRFPEDMGSQRRDDVACLRLVMDRTMPRIICLFVLASCLVGSALPAAHAQDRTLTLFAAASLQDALNDINAAYTARTGVKVAASYAASSVLAKQIEQGAPADIFASADIECMTYAIQKKAIDGSTQVNLLANQLVLIAPKESEISNVQIGDGFDLAKLAGNGKIAIGDVRSVPAGEYAKAALQKLGAWDAAAAKFAMAKNVRVALALVARKEVRLGIVYETDAQVEPTVKVVGYFPPDSYPPVIYPFAATLTAKPEAADYLEYLHSSASKHIFDKYGFTFLIRPTS
jgi:molybdate transport system substrate-binding protein